MPFDRKLLRKLRIPILIALIIVIGCTFISFNGGLIILSYNHYAQNIQTPQLDNVNIQITVAQDSEQKTIIPGLLYYYRIFTANTLQIVMEPPLQENFRMASGGITSGEIKYADGRVQELKEMTASSSDNSVAFSIPLEDLKSSDLTVIFKGYLESMGGEKKLCSAFKKMTYSPKRDFLLRSMANKKTPTVQF